MDGKPQRVVVPTNDAMAADHLDASRVGGAQLDPTSAPIHTEGKHTRITA